MSEQQPPPLHASQADVWFLKHIFFGHGQHRRPVKIITQNFNGPCSFIAICNILILRGQIEILPHDRITVSYEFLSQLLGEYLLTNCPDIDISRALSIMPTTTKGLDLNPQFTSITAFSPASDVGELDLFARAGIPLVHGWLVDPHSPEADVMTHVRDYDTAVTLIADADYLTEGSLLGNVERDSCGAGPREEAAVAGPSSQVVTSNAVADSSSSAGATRTHPSTNRYSDEDRRKIEQAIVAQQFLDATKSQLTYHGLFQLASTLQSGSLAALFRNAHLSVVYKSPGASSGAVTPHSDPNLNPVAGPSNHPSNSANDVNLTASPERAQEPALYALVTDDVFLQEPSIVWERLEDVDGGWSTFVDSDFHRAVPVGGDVAGQTAEAALRRFEMEAGLCGVEDPADRILARQLQAEEDERARQIYERRQQAVVQRRAEEEERQRRKKESKFKGKKIKDCVVM